MKQTTAIIIIAIFALCLVGTVKIAKSFGDSLQSQYNQNNSTVGSINASINK
jgi:Flp pilus assembly pilin Flp